MHDSLIMMTLIAAFASSMDTNAADAVDALLAEYQHQGAGNFNAEKGRQVWNEVFSRENSAEQLSCAACHMSDPGRPGKHARTGKRIEPIAPSRNPDRLTDIAKIRKWLKRNCKGTIGRLCTSQEKGDVLTYIRDL